jgi:hypothetical protein
MHLGAAINGGIPSDNKAPEKSEGLVVLFSLDQELLYNRSERGMVESRGSWDGY